MAPIESSFEIDRPPDEVYAYVTDPSRFPEWQEDVLRVRVEGDRPAGVGTRFTTTRRIGRVEQKTTQEVTDASPPKSWAVRGVDGPFRPSAAIAIEPLGDGTRSLVTIALDFEGHGIGKLLPLDVIRRMAAKGAPRSYQNLKERLER
ncbi:MAG TPA: SRPBCC family protein [Actinomycetes bacterium]